MSGSHLLILSVCGIYMIRKSLSIVVWDLWCCSSLVCWEGVCGELVSKALEKSRRRMSVCLLLFMEEVLGSIKNASIKKHVLTLWQFNQTIIATSTAQTYLIWFLAAVHSYLHVKYAIRYLKKDKYKSYIGIKTYEKYISIEKLQHQKINLETVSMLSFGQLLTGLEARYL